ncbi:MAG TPA: YceD family protein [Verrucomicrobiae bacterium]|nr:YceD family protein [Verrucomicrobiae bacterium]
MPLTVNIRHLENANVRLNGELPVEELDLDLRDEMIRAEKPLEYDIEVQKLDNSLLARGSLNLPLQCQCVRCLKSFTYDVELPGWARHLPLEGEDCVPVVNDLVDLTPHIREDILLEFPQHPLCEAGCRGLQNTDSGMSKQSSNPEPVAPEASPWGELDKLKF